jgi:ABC-type transporter Mla MlaB component
LLDGLFTSLSDEPVSVVFSDSQALVLALRSKTPPGQRSTDIVWWKIRLNALRVMRLQDDFELAALDYCITHEVAPPAWVDAQCQYEDLGYVDATAHSRPDSGPATVPLADHGHPTLALRGELQGDASELLTQMEKNEVPSVKLVISCEALLRVDFAAAGSILNWVAIRQAEGKQIQFQNAHRLVAAFFNVIGINEHAKVIPRPV